MGDFGLANQIVVTIGFCVKNMENTVGAAIGSILKQDFPRDQLELIVVEGGSKDKTASIVKNCLNRSPITYKIYREDKGLGMARQMVIEYAVGKYVLWVDGDMILPESYVRRQVQFMENHRSVGIAGGKYAVHMGDGIVPDLENVVYVVDSVYGEKGASKFGYLPGTEGAIFRMEAIKQIGGFDVKMDGAAEDTEVAYQIRSKGWELAVTNEVFAESTRTSWLSLWKQYAWYGRGGHFIFHKNNTMITLWMMTPLVGFFAGIIRVPGAYLLTHRTSIFLLPIHYTFKRFAWLFGFLKAHISGYGH